MPMSIFNALKNTNACSAIKWALVLHLGRRKVFATNDGDFELARYFSKWYYIKRIKNEN